MLRPPQSSPLSPSPRLSRWGDLAPPGGWGRDYDRNRLALVLAVLGRHAGVGVGTADVFVNVVGGVRVDETGADLYVALAVASAARGVVAEGTARSGAGPRARDFGGARPVESRDG